MASAGLVGGVLFAVVGSPALPASASTGLTDNFIDLTGSIQWDGTGHVGWANGLNQGTGANCSNGGVNLKGTNGLFNCGAPVSIFPPTAAQQPVYNSTLGSANGVFDHAFIQDQTNADTTACPGGNHTGSNIFGGGQKFNDDPQNLTHSLGSATNKDQIGNVYAVARQSSSATGGKNEVYVGLERLVNNGDTHADFQFLQGPVSMTNTCTGAFTGVHRQGDVTLEINFNTGGTNPQASVLIWSCTSATGGGSGTPILSGTQDPTGTLCSADTKLPNGTANPNFVATAGWAQEMQCSSTQAQPCYDPGSVAIAVNDTTTPGSDSNGAVGCGGWVCRSTTSPFTTSTVPTREFMEGAISLDTLGLNAACGAYFFPLTRAAGSADSSQVKAFAPPRKFDTCTGTTTTTTPHDATGAISTTNGISIGSSAHDVAVVTSNAGTAQSSTPPTGSVAFYVCGPLTSAAGCSSADPTRQSVTTAAPTSGTAGTPTANATTFTSVNFTPPKVGTYCFEADFTATGKFENSSDGSSTECFSVDPLTPGFTTSPASSVITFGGSNTDTATVTGTATGGVPGGSVQFYLCQVPGGSSSCSGGNPVGSPVGLKAGTAADTATATSAPVSPAPGTWCFNASYSATAGGNYKSVLAETNGTSECFTVNKQQSKAQTTASGTATFGGGTLSDSVSVSPDSGTGPAPTGTVQFYVCETASTFCPTTGTPDGSPVHLTVPTTGSTSIASAPDFTPTSPGTWCFSAVYSGDGNYLSSEDNTTADNARTSECVVVGKATTKTTTTVIDAATNHAWSGTETVGASAYDISTVVPDPSFSNAPAPTGTVSYVFFNGNGCSGTQVEAGTASLTGHSSTEGPLAFGDYSFQATYSGDSNYSGSTGACENLHVNQGTANVQTTVFDATGSGSPWSGSETTGAKAYDTTTVTGSSSHFAPTGDVTYQFFQGNGCSTPGVGAGGGSLGSADNSDTEGPLGAGGYSFRATYSGDTNYPLTVGPCENFTVQKGTSTVNTTVIDAGTGQAWTGSETTGASAYDTSTVTGSSSDFAPRGGTVSYTFFPNASCTVDTGGSAGGGQLGANSNLEGPLAAGDYSFQASYSGDSNYNSGVGKCEPFTVKQGTSSVGTVVFDAASNSAWTGSETGTPSAYDTATVTASSSAIAPTGTISYLFFTNASCTADTGTSAGGGDLSQGAAPNSSTEGPLNQGLYSFQATYSGDTNYAGSTGACEPFTVEFPVITAAKSSSPADGSVVHPGDTVTYTITLTNSGLQNATGVTLIDAIPAGTTYVPASASDGGTPTSTAISWSGLTVPGGGTKAVSFEVKVNSNDTDGQVIPNHAIFPNVNTPQTSCLQSSDTTPQLQSVSIASVHAAAATATACDTNTVTLTVAIPIVNVVKSEPTPGNGQTVTAGQTAPITYKLAVTNAGSAAATNVVVTDVIPAGATYVTGSATPSGDATFNSTTKTITWTIPTVAAKSGSTPGEVDLTFQVTVNSADANGSTLTNQAAFTDLNTPSCTAGTTSGTCLTNTVSNPVVTPPPLQVTPTPQVAPTTTTTTVPHHALAFTGLNAGTLGIVAVILVGGGTVLVLLGRRRRPDNN